MKQFKILSINISEKPGLKKTPVPHAELIADSGIRGDAHAKNWHRQVSLLAQEDINLMRAKGLELSPGDFAENITTEGIDLTALPVGSRFKIDDCELELTQLGKKCHQHCEIYKQAGDCIMPRRGVFAKVLKGGKISTESIGYYT